MTHHVLVSTTHLVFPWVRLAQVYSLFLVGRLGRETDLTEEKSTPLASVLGVLRTTFATLLPVAVPISSREVLFRASPTFPVVGAVRPLVNFSTYSP